MKMTLGVITGVIIGIIVVLAACGLLAMYAINQFSASNAGDSQPTSTISGYDTSTPTAPRTTPAQPSSTSESTPTATVITSESEEVNFELTVTGISGSGLSRTVSGQITNTGSLNAHNLTGTITVFSGEKQIKINGQESVVKDLGTIAAGETISTQIDLSFGLIDSLNITQNGATIILELISDEKTQTIKYDYQP